jgi:hypothetical protein
MSKKRCLYDMGENGRDGLAKKYSFVDFISKMGRSKCRSPA